MKTLKSMMCAIVLVSLMVTLQSNTFVSTPIEADYFVGGSITITVSEETPIDVRTPLSPINSPVTVQLFFDNHLLHSVQTFGAPVNFSNQVIGDGIEHLITGDGINELVIGDGIEHLITGDGINTLINGDGINTMVIGDAIEHLRVVVSQGRGVIAVHNF